MVKELFHISGKGINNRKTERGNFSAPHRLSEGPCPQKEAPQTPRLGLLSPFPVPRFSTGDPGPGPRRHEAPEGGLPPSSPAAPDKRLRGGQQVNPAPEKELGAAGRGGCVCSRPPEGKRETDEGKSKPRRGTAGGRRVVRGPPRPAGRSRRPRPSPSTHTHRAPPRRRSRTRPRPGR